MAGGMVFVLFKAFEYYQKLQAGFDLNTNLFYTFYWLLTAFHLVHVAVGIVILIFMYKNIHQAKINADDIEAGAAFLILSIAVIKFLLVAFQFLELKKAHLFWKVALTIFIFLITGILFLILEA